MAILYKAFQPILEDKNGNRLFYPRVVLKGNVTTDKIAEEIAEYCSLTKGDTKNALDNLIRVMTTHLQASESVTLDGLGTFRIVMKSGGNGVKTADEVSPTQSKLTVRFLPATTRNLNRTVATRSMTTGARCVLYTGDTTASDGSTSGGSGSTGEGGGETGGGSTGGNPLG